jgi:uncharacterized protein with NAD-binding domain and iron-sulfur cluster
MRKKVVVLGGGVAGLTTAHELIERGFDVTVFEQRDRFGGKAASTSTDGLPGEHGFRFFPGWYQHLPDTLKRIPYGKEENGAQRRTVYHNLVAAQTNLFASYQRNAIPALVHLPRSWADLKTALLLPQRVRELGIPQEDITFFVRKLLEFALKPEADREKEYDKQTWWEFLEADQRSEAFRDYLVDGLTRNTVAANPKQASAYTIGHAALRTLFDVLRPEGIDRVLNGPTSPTWIDPWVQHLRARGVDFVTIAELVSIEIKETRITSVSVRIGDPARRERASKLDALRLYMRLSSEAASAPSDFWSRLTSLLGGDRPENAELTIEHLDGLLKVWSTEFREGRGHRQETEARSSLKTAQPWRGQPQHVHTVRQWFSDRYAAAWRAYEDSLAAVSTKTVGADYFVFALPVEQMAFYVHRSETIRRADPSLANLILLSEQVGWMAGIQFYLTENETITPGHIDCIDSEWRLTAIVQTQFWADSHLSAFREKPRGSRVRAILSVDISAWDIKGQLFKKEAYACTRQEIAEEVWFQLKRSLNRPNQLPVLYDRMLLDSTSTDNGQHFDEAWGRQEVPQTCYHIDNEIINRFDRKKQEFYKKFESVRFSASAVQARQECNSGQNDKSREKALETAFAYGDRIELNAEPLLINRVNSLSLRPGVSTKLTNMLLASDYVRTSTNIATMEAANEAARTAVNEILSRSGSREKPCRLWQWQPSDVLQEFQGPIYPEGAVALEYAAAPFRFAASTASKVTELAKRAVARATERSK